MEVLFPIRITDLRGSQTCIKKNTGISFQNLSETARFDLTNPRLLSSWVPYLLLIAAASLTFSDWGFSFSDFRPYWATKTSLVCLKFFLFSTYLMVVIDTAFLPSSVMMIVLKCLELWINTHIFNTNIILKSAFWNCLGCLEMNKHLSPIFKVPCQRFGFLQTGGGKPLSGHTPILLRAHVSWEFKLSTYSPLSDQSYYLIFGASKEKQITFLCLSLFCFLFQLKD